MGSAGGKRYGAHRAWLFAQQGGICYLQLSDTCRAAGGAMSLDRGEGKDLNDRFATIEHLLPRAPATRPLGARYDLKLLACWRCNHLKSDSMLATPEQLAYAEVLRRVWARAGSHLKSYTKNAEAFAQAGAPCFMRNGVFVYAAPLPVCHDLKKVDVASRERKRAAFALRAAVTLPPADDLPVPGTVEEALAQGGINLTKEAKKA